MGLKRLSVAILVLPAALAAQAPTNQWEVRSHFVGEPVSRFLRLEPEARASVEVCREHPAHADCTKLLNAVEDNGRAEISTTIPVSIDEPGLPDTSIEFVMDKGKIVKITMPVNDVPELMKKFGAPSHEADEASKNSSGAKWQNHTSVWEPTGIYISLYQDNSPTLVDRRPLLTMESPEEHAAENPVVASAQPVSH